MKLLTSHNICSDDADKDTQQIVTGDRGSLQWAYTIAKCVSYEERKKHRPLKYSHNEIAVIEKRQRVVPTFDADETLRCRKWLHTRCSKGLEAFTGEILQHGDANSCHFGGIFCLTASPVLWELSQVLSQISKAYKMQGKQSQRQFSTRLSSIVCDC